MERMKENKFNEETASKETYAIYQTMYQSLFNKISKALAVLNDDDSKAVDTATKILKCAQCEAKKIYLDSIQLNRNSMYSEIPQRLNLQSLGYFLKEESTLNFIHRSSFSQREQDAEHKLREELNKLLDKEIAEKVYYAIIPYASVKEEIQFSLGMKTGARLAILLTDDSEFDY